MHHLKIDTFMTEFLNISLSNNASINNDILAVCTGITEHYKILIPSGPPLGFKPLHVIYNPSTPITFVDGLPNYYTIGLTTNERYYAQIAYQFAHELTHIYCDPRITNWFIEAICEMTSLYFLEYLASKWQTNPPYENWKEYAERFNEYRRNRIEEVKNNLSISNSTEYQEKLESILMTINEPYNRDYNTIIALKIIDIFKKDKTSWTMLPFVGQATDKILMNGQFYEDSVPDFDKLINSLPKNVQEMAQNIKKLIKNGA